MSETARLVVSRFGPPTQVVALESVETGPPGPGEILLEMQACPVHPADLNLIEGTYGTKPALPTVPGNEGAGIVRAVGAGVTRFQPGDWARPPEGTGTWRQQVVCPADTALKLPSGLDPLQAAMLYVNPPTAWHLLHDFVRPEPGSWIIQNAANSAVGLCVVQLARSLGLRTLNLVRRETAAETVRQAGGDLVLVEGPDFQEKLAATGWSGGARLALNGVGGESALRIAGLLETGGTVVTYGAMSRQALKIPNSFLIFKDLRFTGFWMTRVYRGQSRDEKEALLARLGEEVAAGRLHMPVHSTHRLEDYPAALAAALAGERSGKVLFTPNG
jgi:NADPH:quinone reductase-like Zn-dependent oxidoreductase